MNEGHKIVVYTWLTVLTILWVAVVFNWGNLSGTVVSTARPDIYPDGERWPEFCHGVVSTARPDIYPGGQGWELFCVKVTAEGLR